MPTMLTNDIPYSVLFPIKSLFFMEPKVFRRICYARDIWQSVFKLGPLAVKVCLLGYCHLSKVYKCYSIELDKFLVSNDVIFS